MAKIQQNLTVACAYCYKIFKNRRQLMAHLKNHSKYKSTSPDGCKCVLCEENLQNSKNLKAHLEKHASNLVFLCRICYVPFESSVTYNYHLTTQHTDMKSYDKGSIICVVLPDEKPIDEPPVVTCASKSNKETLPGHKPKLNVKMSSNWSKNDLKSPKTNIKSSNNNLASFNTQESDVIDELLAILSQPCPAFETVHWEPPDDINKIFNSIN